MLSLINFHGFIVLMGQAAGIPAEQLQEIVKIILIPIAWVVPMQQAILDFFLHSSSAWIAFLKYLFLFFPLLLWIGIIWCTQLSVYTLPFRS